MYNKINIRDLNMKKLTKILFTIACFGSLVLTACEKSPAKKHTHEYDNDHDVTCNTCGYERSLGDHVAKSDWSHDDTHHWHACAHQGCELIFDYAEHSFDDDHDTTCECGYIRDIGDHAPKSDWLRDDTHHWHACAHEGCKLKFDYGEHQLNPTGGCIYCNKSFETIFTVDSSTQSCDIAFYNLEAKTYYFWVSNLSPDKEYQMRFPYDQVVYCYYYASATATELSLQVFNFSYMVIVYEVLPRTYGYNTTLFFNFTVGQQHARQYTGINVRTFS